ncbi:glycoside hydrolase family 18 protein [Ramaria rubella]|nr:glycoside hydrolase family 18 protein [Ramaria rubella]
MARTGIAALVSVLYALIFLSVVSAVPVKPTAAKPTPTPKILGPQPPHFVAYSDESQFGIPQASDLEGFNTLILSFLLASGPADQADAWTQLSSSQRSSLKAAYKANNITLLVSAFGSTDSPTTDGKDPTALAESMASWVKTWNFDGIDVDYEDFKAVSAGTAVPWLQTFTTVLRKNLPAGQFVITHAPVAPWFAIGQPYAILNATVGNLIDWYNIQFYSQGTAYTTCETLISSSGDPFPGTSLLEIAASGVPQEKLVLGKPGTAEDAGAPDPSGGGGGGTQEAGGGTQEAGGGTQEAGGGTQEAGGVNLSASGGTQEASGGTQEASGGTEEASGGARRRASDSASNINGFVETATLAECVAQAKAKGWNAGVMVWEFPDANADWIQSVRQLSWPFKKVSS